MRVRDGEKTDDGRDIPLRRKAGYGEECVDDILLAHEDGCEQVRDDHGGDLVGVRSLDTIPDEDAEVRKEDDPEQPAIER